MNKSFGLDAPLIKFEGDLGTTVWTIRDAVEGVQIFGGIGSGKTSGSGRLFAYKYLANGFGGLVLTAKADEKQLWQKYCKDTGRLDDLIILEPNGDHFFNFLEYESTNTPSGKPLTQNLVQVLKTVIRASEEKSSGKKDDPFWDNALDMLITNAIDLCFLAYNNVSIKQLFEIVQSAPQKEKKGQKEKNGFDDALAAARIKVNNQVNTLEASLTDEEKSKMNDNDIEILIIETLPDAALLKQINLFFKETYFNLSEKTRSIVEFCFSSFLSQLIRDPVYSLFCRHKSTFTPEDSLHGKIILLNLPVKHYYKVGRDSQILFKYIWQRTMERRNVKENNRPVFLWADEAQNFLHEYDAEYQATARSSCIATVYISQNLPNYYANMGGDKYQYRVKSFLGTLGTKVFHANADIETNQYASDLIGEGYAIDWSQSYNTGEKISIGKSTSFKLEKMVRPDRFNGLATGGPPNDYYVEAYIHLQGKVFKNKLSHMKTIFTQH